MHYTDLLILNAGLGLELSIRCLMKGSWSWDLVTKVLVVRPGDQGLGLDLGLETWWPRSWSWSRVFFKGFDNESAEYPASLGKLKEHGLQTFDWNWRLNQTLCLWKQVNSSINTCNQLFRCPLTFCWCDYILKIIYVCYGYISLYISKNSLCYKTMHILRARLSTKIS